MTRIPLPTGKSDVPSEISIQPSPEGLAAALPEEVQSEVTAVLENREQIQVPETLRSPHLIVKRWLEQKRERRKVDQLSGRRSEPQLDETERRKLRILSAIFTETEKLGHAIKETHGEAYFEIGAQRLDYRLFEPSRQVVIQVMRNAGDRGIRLSPRGPTFNQRESFASKSRPGFLNRSENDGATGKGRRWKSSSVT